VWCHAAATPAEAAACLGCGALYHPACRDEAGQCGTLGCATRSAPPAEQAAPRAYVPGRRAPARCAHCGDERGVLGLVRCPDGGGLFHRACRSSACARCHARQLRDAPAEDLATYVGESLRTVARVLLGVAAVAGAILFVHSLPTGVALPYLVMVLGPVLAALLLQRWR